MANSFARLVPALGVASVAAALSIACAEQARPAFRYVTENACGDVTAHAKSEDGREEIVVGVDFPRIGRRIGGTYHIPISEGGPASVHVNLYEPNEWLPYCSDKYPDPMPHPAVWVARAGIVKLSLASAPPVPYPPGPYRVEVVLEGLTFAGPKGQVIQAPALRFGGFGGWWPGG